ncbi:hypothetical protein [Agromyces sp. GXS1127]|uniref:hypothetical protein n=1 Tax=Agromyces sp. GXS1127 TaxID=3424181 RepID=UPI003D31C336
MAFPLRRRRPAVTAPDEAEPSRPESVPTTEAILGGYRLLRRLAAGDRADVHLAVARREPNPSPDLPDPEPELVVLRTYDPAADDDPIAVEIDAMEHDTTGTLPGLVDVATLPDGRACVVVERIGGGSLASLLVEGALGPGQVVTALAPLVVAVRELARRGLVHSRLAPSDVLVDDTGRPRLIGLGALRRTDASVPAAERVERARTAHGALIALLEELAAASTAPSRFAGVTDLARRMLLQRPFTPDHAAIERALFAAADPAPLVARARSPRLVGPVPSRVSIAMPEPAVAGPSLRPAVGGGRAPTAGTTGAEEPHAASTRSAARRLGELAQLPGLVDGVSGVLDGVPAAAVRRRVRRWVAGRRAVLATGGLIGAGALVLLLTAVPPARAGDPAAEAMGSVEHLDPPGDPIDRPSPAPAQDQPDGSGLQGEPEQVGGGAGSNPTDPVQAAAALLEIRAGCLASRDLACVAAYAQPGSPLEARDLSAMASETVGSASQPDLTSISLAADLGDAVVMKVPDAGGREPASLLMMRSEAGWRLREWFD